MTVAGSIWEVVGGCGADGILVREEKDRASRQASERLARGAVVKALEHDEKAGRLHYELVAGAGPECGWVSTTFKGKDLLVAKTSAESRAEEGVSPALQWYSQRLQQNRRTAEEDEEVTIALPPVQLASSRDAAAQKQQRQSAPPADIPMDMESLMKNALAVSENDRACVGFGAIAGQCRTAAPIAWESKQHQVSRGSPQALRPVAEGQSGAPQAPGVLCPGLAEQLAPCARFNGRGGRECNVVEDDTDEQERRAPCPRCGLPVGDWAYMADGEGAELMHGECMAKLMLETLQKEEESRSSQEASLKRSRREEFGIGWKAESIPRGLELATRLGCPASPQGAYCLVLDPAAHAVRVAPALDPATAVNLEYLAIALQVRSREGREPLFSLDPKTGPAELSAAAAKDLVQVQRFEPAWLAGTSVGDVMFQADYHLKELSMGEHEQPVVGMRSCLDIAEEQGQTSDWRAREWYVVRKADVSLAAGGALLPSVKMGIEARQLVEGPSGLEDARLTSVDHPLVKYAESFSHNFDLIAERKSSVYHLRELAKASVLAKLLLDDDELKLEDAWFQDSMRGDAAAAREIPQLWNERSHCQIRVKDGKLVDVAEGISTLKRGVYGGVQFGVEDLVGEFAAAPLFSAVTALTEEPGQYVSFAEITGGAVVAPRQPRGVDLNLDGFSLSTPTVPAPGPEEGVQACGAFGSAFWTSLDSKGSSVFAPEDKLMLQALFNPSLSDRRGEGESFAPPAAGAEHLGALRALLREEEAARQRRKAHFLSAEFEADNAGPLFPSSWASTLGVAREQPASAGTSKDVRAPNAVEAARLQQAMQSMAPSFDKCTEDGTRFRIYHVSRLEVRTTQDYDGEETIGAVCSAPSPAEVSKPTDVIVKATEYVEAEEAGCHYYVVMETETGNFIVTEKLKDGKARWAANPKHLEARNSLARVTGCVECRGACATVRDIQNSELRALLSNCDRKRYARGVFGLAQPACRKCWAGLTDAQRRAAEHLGAWGAEGWDESAAQVWGMEWWQLSDVQREAAGSLGVSADSWDEVRRKPEVPLAPTVV